MVNVKGKGSKEIKEILSAVSAENSELKRRILSLEKRVAKPAKVITRQKTKTEPFSEYRKVAMAKVYAKNYIDNKIKSSFNTKISDLSTVALVMADFCTEQKIPLRQLGILLFASNYRSVRKKDLHQGRNTGQWYAQTVEAMLNKGLIIRVNPDMKKWVYFSLSPEGDRIVREINRRLKEYLVQDDTEAEGIKCTST